MTSQGTRLALLLFGIALLATWAGETASPEVRAADNGGEARRRDFLDTSKKEKNLSPQRVRELLGPPQRKSRQVLYKRHIEQWFYDPPLGLCVEFDCVLGQKPRLLSVHLLSRRKL
jgi:hypothetical protein